MEEGVSLEFTEVEPIAITKPRPLTGRRTECTCVDDDILYSLSYTGKTLVAHLRPLEFSVQCLINLARVGHSRHEERGSALL